MANKKERILAFVIPIVGAALFVLVCYLMIDNFKLGLQEAKQEILNIKENQETTTISIGGPYEERTSLSDLEDGEDLPSPFDFEASFYRSKKDKFTNEIWELVKEYWTDEIASETVGVKQRYAIRTETGDYVEWTSWACSAGSDMHYRLEKFIIVAESTKADFKIARMVFNDDRVGEYVPHKCIGIYILEKDYAAFAENLREYECSTNRTPYHVGQSVYSGPWLNNFYKNSVEEWERAKAQFEADSGGLPEGFLEEFEIIKGRVDNPAKITKICESDIFVEFENGYKRSFPWEWMVVK